MIARCVSAEVRARLAALRISQREFAERGGWTSHNYVAIRLRDEKPFTLDDVEMILSVFSDGIEEPHKFIKDAWDRHMDAVWDQFDQEEFAHWAQVPALAREAAVASGELSARLAKRVDDAESHWPDRRGLAAAKRNLSSVPDRPRHDIAAHDEGHTISDEQGEDDGP